MRTSQVTNAVAAAALSAVAAAQDDAAANREDGTVAFESASSECLDECVFKGLKLTGDNWRLEAREARAAGIDSLSDGEVRLTDTRFTFDDISLATPNAVFKFANGAVVEAALTGDAVQFASGGARFTAQRLVFTFENEELATAQLKGDPALFEDLERGTTATAELIAYDYRERDVRIAGPFTFNREGRVQLRCLNDDTSFRYALDRELDKPQFTVGPCSAESVREGRAAPAAQNSDSRGREAPDTTAEPPDGTP